MTKRVIAPIIVPNTPDCDYANGEELLSYEKIEALKESFKDYAIIDYQHQFTDESKPYFMKKIGDPVRLFNNDTSLKFEDVTGKVIEVPSGTLWLESDITDSNAEKEIDDLELVAYSITVSEKDDANTVMDIYNKLSTKNAQKENIDLEPLKTIHSNITTKRTLIKDIKDPVMLTVSLVKFPCVNKARFCKHTLDDVETSSKFEGYDKMSEKEAKNNPNQNFIDSIRNSVKQYRESNKKEETPETDVTVDETVNIEGKIEAMKSEIKTEVSELIKENNTELLSAIKDITTVPTNDEEEQTVEESEVIPNKSETEDETKADEKAKPEEEKEPKEKTAGKGDKSYKKEVPLKTAEPSAQPSRKNAQLKNEGKKMSIKRDEFSVIYDAVKNHISTKSQDVEIDYTQSGLIPYNRKYLDFMEDPIMINAYKASLTFNDQFTISEEDTRKAILNTNLFSTYVTRLIKEEPLLQDAQYQTGIHGKGHIYDLDDTIATEDGALPEHYYFDKNVVEQQATIGNREIETYPQRVKINISDRQRLANVYGDDLVNILLDRTIQRLRQGVAVARFYGNKSAATTVDLQYRRQDGYLKEAGVQLTSNDVNLDKITDIFDTMFYALPEEAQVESNYNFYVPTNVRRAFGAYFLDKAGDRAIDYIGQKTPLFWGESEIKVSPTLNNKPMRDLLDGGNVSILLTSPQNTHFVVGREAGIEPKRYPETSSNTYYATIDSANAYSINDYAVRLSLTAEEYAALIGKEESP